MKTRRVSGIAATIVFLGLFPFTVEATCNPAGYSIVLVNGMLNEQETAIENKIDLSDLLVGGNYSETINVYLAYNETHLQGAADLLQAATQAIGKPISNFDRDTILRQMHSDLKTQKILLVGHSQGTFYTNEIYEYLIAHGVPRESIAVYNVATPAGFVAGGGQYLTSGNDNLIARVRQWASAASAPQPLVSNILIPVSHPEADDLWRGHSFSGEYLAGASERIVADINTALANLEARQGSAADGCFEPPPETLAYKAQKVTLRAGDAAAEGIRDGASATAATAAAAGRAVVGGVKNVLSGVMNLVSKLRVAQQSSGVSAKTQLASAAGTEPTQQEEQNIPTPLAEAPLADEPLDVPPIDDESLETEIESPQQAQQVPMPAIENSPTSTPPTATTTPSEISELYPVTPGFGGGGGSGGASASSNSSTNTSEPDQGEEEGEEEEETGEEEVSEEPVAVPLAVTSPEDDLEQAAQTLTITGTTTAGFTVTATYDATTATTTADGIGNWSYLFTLGEGTSTISFVADDGAGNTSSEVSRTITVDLTPPSAPTLVIAACADSLSASFCLLGGDSVELAWDDVGDSYKVVENDALGVALSATSSTESISYGATTSFAIVAYDSVGNAATSTTVEVYATSSALLINELAWAGTDALESDEWIEIYNPSIFTIDMSNVVLEIDGTQVALSGTLAAGDLYLIEDRAEATSADHDTVVDMTLSDSGSLVRLLDAAGNVVDSVPSIATCAGWCAGSSTAVIGTSVVFGDMIASVSMERVGSADGTLATSWQSNDTYTRTSRDDSTGGAIIGSPGTANSAGWPSFGWYCGSDDTVVSGGNYNPSGSCTYLTAAINTLAPRSGSIYRGQVGSSTSVAGHSLGKSIQKTETDSTILNGASAGDAFFLALWESRTGPAFDDGPEFNSYFETGAGVVPHDNYVTIPWVYQP